jgi:hypothetical protein
LDVLDASEETSGVPRDYGPSATDNNYGEGRRKGKTRREKEINIGL